MLRNFFRASSQDWSIYRRQDPPFDIDILPFVVGHRNQQLFFAMRASEICQSTTKMPRLVQHSCANPYFAAAVAALVCLLGLLTLACVAQTAYMLRLRPILARYIREEGYRSDDTYSRGWSRRRRWERYLSRGNGWASRWSLGYASEPYDGGPACAREDWDPWAECGSPVRSTSREDSRHERMRLHRAAECAERRRLAIAGPQSFVYTPSTYYLSPRSNGGSVAFAPSPLGEGQSGRAEARDPARPRARRVASLPSLRALNAWGAACEARGYVYDGKARGYVHPVCPDGYTIADAVLSARQIWGRDLVDFETRVREDDAYVRKRPNGCRAFLNRVQMQIDEL